jgi:prepilin-type N-terminal cleavage/methylation domain-containing protein
LREEGGFTLPEVLVAMTLMVVVFFALYAIFDMSIRVFSFGNDKVEAVENARLGLEKMEREIRAAYPYDKPAGRDYLLWSPGYPATGEIPPSDRISIGNDLDGNRKIECPPPRPLRARSSPTTYTGRAVAPPTRWGERDPAAASASPWPVTSKTSTGTARP